MKAKRFLLQDKRVIYVVIDGKRIKFTPFKYLLMCRTYYQFGMTFSKN